MRSPYHRLFPTGFIGYDTIDIQPRVSGTNRVTPKNGGYDIVDTSTVLYAYDQTVDALYQALANGSAHTGQFEFREQILKAALRLFGGNHSRFTEWVLKQYRDGQVGGQHTEFLRDTIYFIQTGKRTMPITLWKSILCSPLIGKPLVPAGQMDLYCKDLDGFAVCFSPQADRVKVSNVMGVLQIWTGRPNGFDDLLGTLFVLFGPTP